MPSNTIDYKAKAKKLSHHERERILSRMSGKLPKRFTNEKLSEIEAVTIQLAIEDEQLAEWREKVAKIRDKDNKKNKK